MKKLKCIKCGIRYNEREVYGEPFDYQHDLCSSCGFIWKMIGITLRSFENNPFMTRPLNRIITLRLEDIKIEKKK